jgi:death on curing protein
MNDYLWIDQADAIIYHDQQIKVHGGSAGLRDAGSLESAVARPQMKAHYGETDLAVLAAAYGYGIARNHPFIDGNKRTAVVVMEAFLFLQGFELKAGNAELVVVTLALAEGKLSQDDLVLWVRDNIVPLDATI